MRQRALSQEEEEIAHDAEIVVQLVHQQLCLFEQASSDVNTKTF